MASERSSSTDFRPDFFIASTPGQNLFWISHPLLGNFDDDVAGLHILLRRRAVRIDLGDHHPLTPLLMWNWPRSSSESGAMERPSKSS